MIYFGLEHAFHGSKRVIDRELYIYKKYPFSIRTVIRANDSSLPMKYISLDWTC